MIAIFGGVNHQSPVPEGKHRIRVARWKAPYSDLHHEESGVGRLAPNVDDEALATFDWGMSRSA